MEPGSTEPIAAMIKRRPRRHRSLMAALAVAGLAVMCSACSTSSPSAARSTTTTTRPPGSSTTAPPSTTTTTTEPATTAPTSTTTSTSPPVQGPAGGNQGGGVVGNGPVTEAYAQCMRNNGVPNYPDPVNGTVSNLIGRGINPMSPQFQAALKACQSAG